MRRNPSTTSIWLFPTLLAAALTAGCVGLAEEVATHLAAHDLKAIDQDLTVIDGDLALFKHCLENRGGTCKGSTSTPVPHSSQALDSKPATPVDPGGSQRVADSVASLPAGHPAKTAHEVLTHPVVKQAAAVHDHLRGHDTGTTPGVTVKHSKDADGGKQSIVTMALKLDHTQHFHDRLLSSIGIGAWAALHDHCQSVLSAHQGEADYDKIEATCRHVAFIRGYLSAYLRKGEFLKVDIQLAGAITAVQNAGTEIEADIQSLQGKIGDLEADVGTTATQAVTAVAHGATFLTTRLNQLIRQAEADLTQSLGAGIAGDLTNLVNQLEASASGLVSQVGTGTSAAITQQAQDLDQLLGRVVTELQALQTKVGSFDQQLVGDINTEVGKANSKLSDVFRVSNVGFVSRDGTFQARLPAFEIALGPTAMQLLTVTDVDTGQLLTNDSDLANLGVASDTSGVGTGASIGAELVRVFFEAIYDAAEGLPAIAPANQGGARPTGLTLGDYSLPTFQTTQGNIDSQNLAHLTYINDQVAARIRVLVSRIISGIGPFSLNNPSLESLITEIVTTSVRKAVAKGTWCWYACDLDVATTKLKTDLGQAAKDEEAKLKAKFEAEKAELKTKLAEVQARLKQAIEAGEKKAQARIEAEEKKIQTAIEKAYAKLEAAEMKVERKTEHVKLRLKLSK